jgi:hypothetical protein
VKLIGLLTKARGDLKRQREREREKDILFLILHLLSSGIPASLDARFFHLFPPSSSWEAICIAGIVDQGRFPGCSKKGAEGRKNEFCHSFRGEVFKRYKRRERGKKNRAFLTKSSFPGLSDFPAFSSLPSFSWRLGPP